MHFLIVVSFLLYHWSRDFLWFACPHAFICCRKYSICVDFFGFLCVLRHALVICLFFRCFLGWHILLKANMAGNTKRRDTDIMKLWVFALRVHRFCALLMFYVLSYHVLSGPFIFISHECVFVAAWCRTTKSASAITPPSCTLNFTGPKTHLTKVPNNKITKIQAHKYTTHTQAGFGRCVSPCPRSTRTRAPRSASATPCTTPTSTKRKPVSFWCGVRFVLLFSCVFLCAFCGCLFVCCLFLAQTCVVVFQVRVRVPGRHQPDLVAHVRSALPLSFPCLHFISLSHLFLFLFSLICADLINVFSVFLPQLLLYPNPTDPLNGAAASLMLKDKKAYEAKVRGRICVCVCVSQCDRMRVRCSTGP